MVALTNREIKVELKRLGITELSELKSYLKKYKEQYTLQFSHLLGQEVIITKERENMQWLKNGNEGNG